MPARLAAQLFDDGHLAASWRPAFEEVRREDFLPDRLWVRDGAAHTPVDRAVTPGRWRELARSDIALVTRVEDECALVPASSASMPRMVAVMLRALRAEPGHRVLEAGTGTGFNAALLAHRLGDDRVTSIEIDPVLADTARVRLAATGRRPAVITGDADRGWPGGAPYDRVVVTYALHDVPHALVRQTAPGGHLVLPWGTGLYNGVLVRLTRGEDAVAHGPVIGDSAFMWDRRQAPRRDVMAVVHHESDAAEGATVLDPRQVFGEEDAAFAAGLLVPDCRYGTGHGDGGEFTLWLADAATGSWASLDFAPDTEKYPVQQHGPRMLWDEVAAAHTWWQRTGRPHRRRFGLTVHPAGQHFWLDDPGNRLPARP